jgi:hypothetical protein
MAVRAYYSDQDKAPKYIRLLLIFSTIVCSFMLTLHLCGYDEKVLLCEHLDLGCAW